METSLLYGLLCIAAGIHLVYFIARIAYNIYIHPLSKFPGPKYLSATRIPWTVNVVRGESAFFLRRLHEQYGPVVRIAPNQISYADEKAWTDIYGSTLHAKSGFERDNGVVDLLGGDMINPNSSIPRAQQMNSRMRRTFSPGLTRQALVSQQPIIVGHIDGMVKAISRNLENAHNVINLVQFTAYNLFSDLFLGESLNLFEDPKYRPWVYTFPAFAKGTAVVSELQHYGLARSVLKFAVAKFSRKHRDAFISFANERFNRRLAKGNDRQDLLKIAMGENKKLSISEIREFAPYIMVAGSETTPTLLSGLVYLILKDPMVMGKLTQEIRSTFESDSDITIERISELPYLNACIQEALRVYPPVSGGIARIVPEGGAPIVGEWIPGGTHVLIPQFATFRSSFHIAKPNEYHPDRWLPNADPIFANDRRDAINPFGFGPTICIGVE
ncbi:MAG: hypothetical protein M1839_003961 [Geoglossum umbratile]|nr:MAG: hypothetical protein M1839_003961 [Geoglossum umbratile]